MFQITETTCQGDFHKVVTRAGRTMRKALDALLTESPYNGSMNEAQRSRISQELVDKGEPLVHHGWASYTAEYRGNLEDTHISYTHKATPEFGIVVEDQGDELVVRHPASAAQQTIDASSVVRYK